MNKQILVGIIIGFIVGGAATFGVTAATQKDTPAKNNAQTTISGAEHNTQTTAKLKDLKGDDFDKAFIEEMITHHQGAIEMAKLIGANAKHDELDKLGQDIISAQTSEIDMMQKWQNDWGYKTPPNSHDVHQQQ